MKHHGETESKDGLAVQSNNRSRRASDEAISTGPLVSNDACLLAILGNNDSIGSRRTWVLLAKYSYRHGPP